MTQHDIEQSIEKSQWSRTDQNSGPNYCYNLFNYVDDVLPSLIPICDIVENGIYIFAKAISNNRYDILKLLIDKGIDLNSNIPLYSKYMATRFLHIAIYKNDTLSRRAG